MLRQRIEDLRMAVPRMLMARNPWMIITGLSNEVDKNDSDKSSRRKRSNHTWCTCQAMQSWRFTCLQWNRRRKINWYFVRAFLGIISDNGHWTWNNQHDKFCLQEELLNKRNQLRKSEQNLVTKAECLQASDTEQLRLRIRIRKSITFWRFSGIQIFKCA